MKHSIGGVLFWVFAGCCESGEQDVDGDTRQVYDRVPHFGGCGADHGALDESERLRQRAAVSFPGMHGW